MICNYHIGQTERLSNLCLPVVAKNVGLGCILDLECLPVEIKDKLLLLVTKRGTLSEDIANKILHSKVKRLDMSECKVTNGMLISVSNNCPMLSRIDLNSLKGSRDEDITRGLYAVSKSCSNICGLLLRRCISVNDEIITSFSYHCLYLKTINISGCTSISDEGLYSIAMHCKALENLDISKTQITEKGLIQLSNSVCAAKLKEILLTGCEAVTDAGIHAIVNSCPNLNIFIFHSCPKVTSQCRVSIELSLSNMKQMSWTVY